MTHATIRSLSKALGDMRQVSPRCQRVETFNPVVTLQPNSVKTALWLIHPGIGEDLVFLGLAQHFPFSSFPSQRFSPKHPKMASVW